PGQLSFSSAGNGATSHLATELLMARSGISMLHVPYRGGAPSAQAVVTGEVRCSFIDLITSLPLSRAGNLRILGVSTATRSPLAPDVPTIAEAGVPGFESSTDAAFLAPAGTPEPIIRRLNEALREALSHPETRQALLQQAVEPIGSTPQEFAAYLAAETAKWGEIIRARGIRMG
ncbi:MAG: Bug family tripartite tricarboxylate transporter substrate binding protein, partial [Paracoccaceae bacterium]